MTKNLYYFYDKINQTYKYIIYNIFGINQNKFKNFMEKKDMNCPICGIHNWNIYNDIDENKDKTLNFDCTNCSFGISLPI